ncbi:MAG TPA: FUSC family protein [Casimicrobiaceae bacterium]|nr:FUSC family protein [Casimicrobiaceae bacterium]
MRLPVRMPSVTLRENALIYMIKLLTGSLVVWYGLRAAGIHEPIWAMISLIVVTEPALDLAKRNFRARVVNTVNGTVVACAALWIFGATFGAMLASMIVATMIAMSFENYPNNWRLAPNTTVVLMSAALAGTGFSDEVRLAMLRVAEVMTGSTVALLQTIVYAWVMKRIGDHDADAA